jgi:hypothetical protein
MPRGRPASERPAQPKHAPIDRIRLHITVGAVIISDESAIDSLVQRVGEAADKLELPPRLPAGKEADEVRPSMRRLILERVETFS